MAIRKKICMLGDVGVGKTSLVRRYVLGEFSDKYQTTLGVNIYKYTDQIETPAGATEFNHLLWDIEGGLQHEKLLGSYLRGSAGAIVVGDVTRDDRLQTMRDNVTRFHEARPGQPVVFAFNKIDLVQGPPDDPGAEELVRDYGGVVEYTSALTGEAVKRLFRALAERILTEQA